MQLDKRIALVILLLLILINIIFFFLLKPHASKELKNNHSEDNGDVIFPQDGNNYSRDERVNSEPVDSVSPNQTPRTETQPSVFGQDESASGEGSSSTDSNSSTDTGKDGESQLLPDPFGE